TAERLSFVGTSNRLLRREFQSDGRNALRRQSDLNMYGSILVLPCVRLRREARGRLQLLHIQCAQVLRLAHLAPRPYWIRVSLINTRKIGRARLSRSAQVKLHLLGLDRMIRQRVIRE